MFYTAAGTYFHHFLAVYRNGFVWEGEGEEMEFLSYSVSDQLDFSTEELGDTHKP